MHVRGTWLVVWTVGFNVVGCSGDTAPLRSDGGSGSMPGNGPPGNGAAGMAGRGSGMPGPGMAKPGPGGTDTSSLPTTCSPGVAGTFVVNCGYPSTSASPLTSVTFNEDEVLRAIQPAISGSMGVVRAFYNDEHALTLGVRSVVVKTASGATTSDFAVTALPAVPSSATSPRTGTNDLVGNTSGLDASLRPMWPSLFITDITSDLSSRAGDWQHGGRPINPDAIFGTWKAAVRTVDTTRSPAAVTITPDADPAKNDWSLAGGDTVPSGLSNEGYGAEMRWSVPLASGRSYRLQVIVHDGDQNQAGGDSGEQCVVFCSGGGAVTPDAGTPPPTPHTCPSGTVSCLGDGIDLGSCQSGLACVNGCCIPVIL
jgi:hypothetical protein